MATRSEEVSHHYYKETLLSEHQNLRSSIRINTPHQIHPQAVRIQSGKLIELNKFEAIRISDLSPNNSNQNKLIYSTQISPLAVAEPICFIVEDEYENACRVILFALADTSHLVKGVKLAFSNPVYRMAFDGKYSLIVHNISDVFILGMNQSVESYLKLSVKCDSEISIASTAGESDQENHEQIIQRRLEQQTSSIDLSPYNVPADDGLNLSEIGNKLFKEGRYSQAIVQYTCAIQVNDKNAKFYSNRAICYNKTEEFENALSDIQKANLLDPDCVKYQYWVALTWSRIGNHKLSLDLLKKINAIDEVYITSVKKLISQEEAYLRNIRGVIDIPQIVQNLIRNQSNEIADYIGPIQILNSPDKGRGIFTTRNVKKGEKLCVVNATEIVEYTLNKCPCRICKLQNFLFLSKDKFVHPKLIEKARKSKLTTVRIISLCDRSITNVNIDLYSGCGYEFAKNFDTTLYPMDKLHTLVVDNICLGFNQLNPVYFLQAFGEIFDQNLQISIPTMGGVWLLPSFINHSCIPNVVMLYLGNICIVRAITDIPEGEELFSNYTPLSLFPKVEDRNKFLNFSCTCKFCEFERREDVRKIILQILQLEDRLGTFRGVQNCITHPLQVAPEEIPKEIWLEIKDKMIKLVKQLGKKKTDDILSGSFQSALISLLICKPPEDQVFELLMSIESYFSLLELESYMVFWTFFKTIMILSGKLNDPHFQYVAMKFDEFRQFLS